MTRKRPARMNWASDGQFVAGQDIAERCLRFARHQGFPYYFLMLHLLHDGEPRQILLSNYPREWTEHYDRKGYFKIDPVAARLIEGGEPFGWESVSRTPEHRRFFADAAKFGLIDGFSVPVQRASGEMAAFSLAGARVSSDRDLRDRYFSSALLFAVRMMEELRTLARELPSESSSSLTARQKEILTLVANGSTIKQAALRLGVHIRTAEDALKRAMENLEVATREEAIVRAVLSGQIAPLPFSAKLSDNFAATIAEEK
jgi:LuxR family quorum-sensing system transcriptional regulator CciR